MNKCEVNFGRGQCLGLLSHVYGISGNEREAKRLLAELKRMSRSHLSFQLCSPRRTSGYTISNMRLSVWSKPLLNKIHGCSG